jgi:hypothetical protein
VQGQEPTHQSRPEQASASGGVALPVNQHLALPQPGGGQLVVGTERGTEVGLAVGERRLHPLEPGSESYLPAPILKIFVPQTGHEPSVAGRPFFIVICFAFLMSRWALHFMQ